MGRTLVIIAAAAGLVACCSLAAAQTALLADKYYSEGTELYRQGRYDGAIEHYQDALIANRELGRDAETVACLMNIGRLYEAWSQYDKALGFYQQALEIGNRVGQTAEVAVCISSIGTVYAAWGQYDRALQEHEKALAITRKLGRDAEAAICLSNIGRLYEAWGCYEKAIESHKEALAITLRLGADAEACACLGSIGRVHEVWREFDKALDRHQEALAIARKSGREAEEAVCLGNIGRVHDALAHYERALECYQKALSISRRLGKEAEVADLLSCIGRVHEVWGRYEDALAYHEQALAAARRMGSKPEEAKCLSDVGSAYLGCKAYDLSIASSEESVFIKERLRRTAAGTLRVNYFASQIHTYEQLVLACLRSGNAKAAFAAAESASARYLAERLGGDFDTDQIRCTAVNGWQAQLPRSMAIVKFTNVNRPETIRLVVHRDSVHGAEVPLADFVSGISRSHGKEIDDAFGRLRGVRVAGTSRDVADSRRDAPVELERIVNYYRYLLTCTEPAAVGQRGIRTNRQGSQDESALEEMSKSLYLFLFGAIEPWLADKTELLIFPDGILGFLPFESLKMPDGRYLGERYVIRYGQSMRVLDKIGERVYPTTRDPLLAMGGAVYEKGQQSAPLTQNEGDVAALRRRAGHDLTRSARIGSYYGELGYGQWSDLPGSLKEATEIKALMRGGRAITGSDLRESVVKRLSASGELARYRVIHIATHGLVVPEVPDLSALVLSQEVDTEDDGYLTAKEIAELKLRADFVCLSACDTGIGKVYGGEGIVGFAQSFLVAGANGLCVSLWKVDDESTRVFMVQMYRAVSEQGMGYAGAISEIKRKFIRGECGKQYRSPYYWAPFVYYGK